GRTWPPPRWTGWRSAPAARARTALFVRWRRSGRRGRRRLDEPQAVESRARRGQLVGEALREVQDHARLVRRVDGLRRPVRSTEHARDQPVDRFDGDLSAAVRAPIL